MVNIGLKDKDLYYIGGVVRDELLGTESFDTDLTYQGNAIKFCKNLEDNNIGQCIKINKDFGTVRMLIDGKEIDIASTRDEIYEHKGHLPTVYDIGCDLKKDIKRRDFTINSLAKSTLTGEIIDYTDGIKDIHNKKLKILHDNSFIDDPTRIVRGLKFAVRFGFELDEHTKNLQNEYLCNINYDMSYKRLKKELIETFNLNRQDAYERFTAQKIYKLIGKSDVVPPDYDIENLIKKYPVDNIWIVYTGWHDDIENLPLTKIEQKITNDYRELLSTTIKDDKFSLYKTFENKSTESILLYTIKTGSEFGLKYFEIKDIKISITGEDLKSIGILPSKKYSDCFDFVLRAKIENPQMTKNEEIQLAKNFFEKL